MLQKLMIPVVAVGLILVLGGCPTQPGGGTNMPPGDPTSPVQGVTLSIITSSNTLQRNEAGGNATFPRTAQLTAVFSDNVPRDDVSWQIFAFNDSNQRIAPTVLLFDTNQDSNAGEADQTTGRSVAAVVNAVPQNAVIHEVVAQATIDGVTRQATALITVQPDQIVVEGDIRLTTDPFATPAFLDTSTGSTITLSSNVLGAQGATSFRWSALIPPPAGVTEPANLLTENIELTVTDPNLVAAIPYAVVVTDATETSAVGVVTALVNMPGLDDLDLDIAPTQIVHFPNTTINLRTVRTGGAPDTDGAVNDEFTYTLQVLDEGGTDVTATTSVSPASGSVLDGQVNDWTVTGLSAAGAYRFIATVTDSSGQIDTAMTTLRVDSQQDFTLSSAANLIRVPTGAGFNLRTVRTGGEASFTYTFDVLDAMGNDASSLLGVNPPSGTVDDDATNDWTVTGGSPGTYRIITTATDGRGRTATAATRVLVGDVLTLAVDASRLIVGPGTGFSLVTERVGGETDFTYTFRVFDPSDTDVTGSITIRNGGTPVGGGGTVDNDIRNVFTVDGIATAGTYRFFVTVTDGRGFSFTGATDVYVGTGLTVDLRSTNNTYLIAPGGTTNVAFDANGGVGPYDYVYVVAGPSANGTFTSSGTATGTQNNVNANATDTWTAPSGAGASGGYTIFVTVTDAVGNTAEATLWFLVQPANALTLDVRSSNNAYIVQPGATSNLTFAVNGGVGPYDYVYTMSGPGGAGAFTTGSPQNDLAGNATDVWTAPNASGADGSYRLLVTVTDAEGRTASDTIWLAVLPAEPLTVDARSSNYNYAIAPGGTSNITFSVNGGAPPYDYVYSANGIGGNGTFTTGSPQNDLAGNATDVWTAPAGPGSIGSYRIFVTVTDNLGNTAEDSFSILVRSVNPLQIDTSLYLTTVAPGVPVRVRAEASGGTPGSSPAYNFGFESADSQDDTSVGAFGTQNVVGPVSLVTYVPPIDGSGTIRITAAATDSVNDSAEDVAHLFVTEDTTIVSADVFIDPPTAQTDLTAVAGFFDAGQPLPSGGSPLTINPGDLDQSSITNARNLTIFLDDADDGVGSDLNVASVEVNGTNARGQTIQELINSPGEDSTVELSHPFATITSIVVTYSGEDGGGLDSIEIGIGQRFGLSGKFGSSTNAFHVVATATNLAAGNITNRQAVTFLDPDVDLTIGTADDTGMPTTNQQFVIFANDPPDGSNDYIVQVGVAP